MCQAHCGICNNVKNNEAVAFGGSFVVALINQTKTNKYPKKMKRTAREQLFETFYGKNGNKKLKKIS
jgi:hypothetical protein